MAGTGVWVRLLERHRARLSKDPDMNRVLPKLMKRGFFSNIEERHLAGASDATERTDVLIDKLSRDPDAFREFCMTLEECAPHLLTELLLSRGEVFAGDPRDRDSQALDLELGFELALKERDAALREQSRTSEELTEARRRLDALQVERDRAVRSLENLSMKQGNLKGRNSGSSLQRGALDVDDPQLVEERSRRSGRSRRSSRSRDRDRSVPRSSRSSRSNKPVFFWSGDNVVWQIHKVTLQRVANYGFGIAVSGGHDSPHFASGDPSIAISDVLKAGPAEGKLQLNDRIISVNGISLENVSHSMAIQVLKNSGDSVHLVVRRRVVMPAAVEKESPPLRVTLVKKSRKDEFGLLLGCRFFLQDVMPDSLAAQDGGLKIGDTILKINNTPLDGLSLMDVKKLVEKTKDRLQLIVSKSHYNEDRTRPSGVRHRDDDGFRSPHDKEDVNLYRPGLPAEDAMYPGDLPPGAYPGSAHYDGRFGFDPDVPARPPPPGTFPRAPHRNDGLPGINREPQRAENFYSAPPRRDPEGYYSDHDVEGFRRPPEEEDMFARPHHDERYVGMRSDIGTDIRRVVFQKDRQKGLGLRLAGGNATGIFIASVQPGSAAEAEGLVEGDQILQANGLDIVGLTREEAVAHLTGLEGQVTLLVQYKKEDYDGIMASHEAGDSFYIRTHFSYQPTGESGDHAFKAGDIFHIKDTLFRGVGGSWLAIRVGPTGEEMKKGTIPNKKKAESLANIQQDTSNGRDTLPAKGKGSLFKRKSARRAKSLGKDHWEEVIFSGLATKFPPYERVVLRDPAFVRPVVVFGAISDVARDMLQKEFPDRFVCPQTDKAVDNDPKKGKTGIIRFGAIREAIDHQKHCVLDVTPYHVDRLNYAQYYPIVVFLKGESKQAIKDVRSRWRGSTGTNKNPKKLQEHNERMESLYAHLFTGVITHTTTDVWFPKLVEMIQAQQRRPVWMSEKKPEEDFNDDFMFPMPNRLSMSAAPESELDLARPADDLDISPSQKKRLMRSSSDPSINTADRVPGIPPYPAPPGYHHEPKMSPYDKGREDWDDYRHPAQNRDRDWQMHPEDRYYPQAHHPPESWTHPYPPPQGPPYGQQRSRSSIDVYATITPSERVRKRLPHEMDYPGPIEDFGPPRDRMLTEEMYHMSGPRSPHDAAHSPSHPPGGAGEPRSFHDGSSNDNDSYSRYVSSPANKHDDSKLRDKFGSLQLTVGRERSPGSHDPYRFTRSTANPVPHANIDRAKLSHLTAKYRQEERQGKPGTNKAGGPSVPPSGPNAAPDGGRGSQKKKEPPPVPAKNYTLKEVGMDVAEVKARNYENSNSRSYNYSDMQFPGQQQHTQPPPPPHGDHRYQHDPNQPPPPPPLPPQHAGSDSPYEYISARNVNARPQRRGDNYAPEIPPPPRDDYDYDPSHNSRAFSNSVYMDQREVERVRYGVDHAEQESAAEQAGYSQGYTRPRTDDEQLQDLQVQRHRTRIQSEPRLADRAKSETRLNEGSPSRWNKYKSWDSEKEGQRTFDSYKKLITPGFYGSRKIGSRSQDELREDRQGEEGADRLQRGGGAAGRGQGGAADSYRAVTQSLGLQSESIPFPRSHPHLASPPLPPPPPPPPPPPSLSRPAFTEMPSVPNKPLPPPPIPPLPLVSMLTTFPAHTTEAPPPKKAGIARQNSTKETRRSTNERADRTVVNGVSGSRRIMRSSSADGRDVREITNQGHASSNSFTSSNRFHPQNHSSVNHSKISQDFSAFSRFTGNPNPSANTHYADGQYYNVDRKAIHRQNPSASSCSQDFSAKDRFVNGQDRIDDSHIGKGQYHTSQVTQNTLSSHVDRKMQSPVERPMNKVSQNGGLPNDHSVGKTRLEGKPQQPSVTVGRQGKVGHPLSKSMSPPPPPPPPPVVAPAAAVHDKKGAKSSVENPPLPFPPSNPAKAVSNRASMEFPPPPPPAVDDVQVKGHEPKASSVEPPLPPPPSLPTNGTDPVKSQALKTSPEPQLPPPPPPSSSNNPPSTKPSTLKTSSVEPPLPPPPPSSATDADKENSPTPSSLPKTTPLPPPPPPLIVTPLPLASNGDKGEKQETQGKRALKRLSGSLGKEKTTGDSAREGEASEKSESSPDGDARLGQEVEEGQTVVATARGVFTSAGGVLESKETGVSIVIPEGALDEGSSQEIYFKVCSGNSILPPLDEDKGETLLSPLVMCGPHGLKFNKAVELRLPHSASVNPESWSFALKSSDSPAGQPTQWQNMTLAGSGVAHGHVNQNSVSVLVDHF